jgi:RecB family exonuclease
MPYLQGLEQRRLESLLADWLEIERRRTPFDIVSCEDSRPVRIGGLELEVKADRVDALMDGRHVIIDYKTGDPNPNQWEGDRPDAPQLPLYAVSHTTQLAAVAFARLAPGESGFKGLGENAGMPGVKGTASTLASQIGDWARTLEQLALEFRAGNAMVAPKRYDTCEHCPLPAFCRIAEAGDREQSEETDG